MHLVVLQKARAKGCFCDERTCEKSNFNVNLEILQWARGNGERENNRKCLRDATLKHLNIQKKAKAKRCPWHKDTRIMAQAYVQPEVFKRYKAHGCP